MSVNERTTDAAFAKYAEAGAYHWHAVGGHWWHHHAFTAERYRRSLAAAGNIAGKRALDFGCGDGAFLGLVAKAVGENGSAVGFDPNDEGRRLAAYMLAKHGLKAEVVGETKSIPDGSFDVVICNEVIEHVHEPLQLLAEIHRLLKPGGTAVVTTPIRLHETPEDSNHVQEWFFGEFAEVLKRSPLRLRTHEASIPAGSVEMYYWRPKVFFRLPVFRLLSNLLSIYFGVNAMTWLGARPRLFMQQIAVLDKPGS
jgi:2-polyprenyl-3-methyl-5-hydroxy-6-metoxy-1,4-benzoquinol methylase